MNGQWRRSPLLAVGSSCRFALLLTRNRRLRHVSGCETGDQLFLEHTVAQRCTAVASTAFWQHTFIAQGVQEVKLSFFVPEWRKITDFSFFTKNICFSEFRCFNTFQWRFEALALYVSTWGGVTIVSLRNTDTAAAFTFPQFHPVWETRPWTYSRDRAEAAAVFPARWSGFSLVCGRVHSAIIRIGRSEAHTAGSWV